MNVIKKYSGIGGGVQVPDTLIIHSMFQFFLYEGQKIHASEFLSKIGLSAHFLIEPNGDVIKIRKTTEKAWHAKGHNTDSVGIEVLVEGTGTYEEFLEVIKTDWVKKEQMDSTIELSNGIIEHYDISDYQVVRHSDIDPERKQDPGTGFDWDWFKSNLI